MNEQQLLDELNKIQGRVSIPDRKAATLQQPQGRDYRGFHEGALPWIGGIAIIGMLLLLALFLDRGPIVFQRLTGMLVLLLQRLGVGFMLGQPRSQAGDAFAELRDFRDPLGQGLPGGGVCGLFVVQGGFGALELRAQRGRFLLSAF